MTTPVQFTLEAAQRISNAVRKVEIGDRAQAPLAFSSFIPQGVKQIAYGHRMPTDFSPWAYGDVRTVVLHGVSEKTPVYGSVPPNSPPGTPPPLLGTHEDYVTVQARNMVGNLESFDVVDHTSLIPVPGPYRTVAKPPRPTLILAKAKNGWDNAQAEWLVVGPPATQSIEGWFIGETENGSFEMVTVRTRFTSTGYQFDSVIAQNIVGRAGTPAPASDGSNFAIHRLTSPRTRCVITRSNESGTGWVISALEAKAKKVSGTFSAPWFKGQRASVSSASLSQPVSAINNFGDIRGTGTKACTIARVDEDWVLIDAAVDPSGILRGTFVAPWNKGELKKVNSQGAGEVDVLNFFGRIGGTGAKQCCIANLGSDGYVLIAAEC